jgi:hypothetical protein
MSAKSKRDSEEPLSVENGVTRVGLTFCNLLIRCTKALDVASKFAINCTNLRRRLREPL